MITIDINDQLKEEFVQKVYPNQNGHYLKILKGSKRKEVQFNKNIYEFNLNELEILLKSYNLSTYNSVRTYAQAIKSYIKYCVETGHATHNPLDNVFSSKWFEQFLPQRKLYLSDKVFNKIIEECKNPQDAVILQLLFEGAGGKTFSELLNLKVADVNIKDNTLKLNDKGRIRYLSVSQKCIDLIFQADKKDVYFSKNGNSTGPNSMPHLIPSEFVIKPNKMGRKGKETEENSDEHLIYRRLSTIVEVFNLPPKFGAQFFKDSGKIALAKNIYEEKGYLAEDLALEKISKRFNIKKQTIKGKEYPAHSLKQFTNADIIYDIYNLEFQTKRIDPFILVGESSKDTEETTEVRRRVRQAKFSDDIYFNYFEKCAITNESIKAVLESAHIESYTNEQSHHPQNGILLRIDFHRLFDNGLITINENYELLVSDKVESDYYQSFNKRIIRLPRNKDCHPSQIALQHHRETYKENFHTLSHL
ncbi:HNH endonuclease [Peribacillus simplex]|uniref:phage lytic cycle repressor MrpR family protein n=1 Tax=Peribacillus simplex TaxID=1478 RepID=UPI003827737C